MVSWVVAQNKKTEREKISAVQKDPLLFACHFGCPAPQLTKHMEQVCPKYIWVIDQV